jgi:hypothetical protein
LLFAEREANRVSASRRRESKADADSPDPPLAEIIEEADKVGAAGWTKTKHTQRIIPVERLAPETDLDRLAEVVIEKHFPVIPVSDRPDPLPSFRVSYEEHSAAMHLHGTDVMKRVADLVPKDSYRVDLETPERTILVVVAGGSCMMSVVKGYGANEKYHHFRIHSAADLGPPSTVTA